MQENYATLRPRLKSSKPHPRSTFSHDEDIQLLNLVNRYGQDWKKVAEEMPDRNVRQCKERYMNYLSPNISTAPWTEQEDKVLLEKLDELGPKWVRIAKLFPNRTDAHLKNRWFILMRRKKKAEKERLKSQLPEQPTPPVRAEPEAQKPDIWKSLWEIEWNDIIREVDEYMFGF